MTNDLESDRILECSFCSKTQEQVRKLVAGPSAYICDECISLCYDIVQQDDEVPSSDTDDIPSPRQIREFLDQYVIGQDYAKMVVSVAVHNHYKRLKHPIINDVEIEKSNILMLGPTGSGKTLVAKTIARLLDVPFYMADATTITEAGYVGDDVETILSGLLQNANGDVAKAQRGIIYIDEIDKKSGRADSPSVTRDVSGEGVQQALLKIIEGTVSRVPPNGGRKHPQQEMIEIDTTNILFIVGGAFVGLDKIVANRMNRENASMGFGAKVVSKNDSSVRIAEVLENTQPQDLVKFGLIPELIGRLPVIAPLDELTEDQMIDVLTKPKNAIVKQFQGLFQLEQTELDITESALREIAKTAISRKTGARGLRSVVEHRLMKTLYELPDLKKIGLTKVVVNDAAIRGEHEPIRIFPTSNVVF
jgi:ATP-dependent Clp protease ATP-binding subunit ClpX